MAGQLAGRPHRPGSLDQLLANKEIAIFCGSGGVGKTTAAAAAAAMASVRHGGRVLAVTVDPARRLADALGVGAIGDVETPVPRSWFEAAGVAPRGELWAAMLDTKQAWDALVRRHAGNQATAQQILGNPLYQSITGRFAQSHDYIAMERLFEIHGRGDYDLIVVDTPPTSNALDFLQAPTRMAEFFSSRLLRWLIVPYRSRLVNLASRPFYQVADRLLGTQFLEDIAQFFVLFQSMYHGFVERAEAVTRLLHDRRTTFVVVSTLEAAPVREAEEFIKALHGRRYHLGAVVLNKVLPGYLRDGAAAAVAEQVRVHAPRLAEDISDAAAGLVETTQVARVLGEVAESFLNFQAVANWEADRQAELSVAPEVLSTVEFFADDISDLGGLLHLGLELWG